MWPRNWFPSPSAVLGAFHQAGDVNELKNRRDDLLRVTDFREHLQPFIRNGNDSLIGFDGAEPIIGRHRLSGLGYRVEESAFADVRQTYNTCAEHVKLQCIEVGRDSAGSGR